MSDMVYLFTHQEFALLLAAAGIRRMYGYGISPEPPDRENALRMLQMLSRKGYLTANGERFVLSGEMKPIFDQMGEAESVLEVHKASGRSCLLYLGRGCVRLSGSLRRPEILELQRLDPDHVWEWLEEEGWIPERRKEDDPGGDTYTGIEPAI